MLAQINTAISSKATSQKMLFLGSFELLKDKHINKPSVLQSKYYVTSNHHVAFLPPSVTGEHYFNSDGAVQ